MKLQKLAAITSLVIGAVLLILAGYSPGTVPYNYSWNVVALALGLVFIIWTLGTLRPEKT